MEVTSANASDMPESIDGKSKEKARPERTTAGPKTLHHFFDPETGYYTSPNAEYMPSPTRPLDKLRNIFDGLKTRWAYDDYFYLALVPIQPRYDLPMLDCLSPLTFKVNAVTIENRRAYQIDPDLVRRWTLLENIVVRLQRKLLQRIAGTYLLTTVPPYPSHFGYDKLWLTEAKAVLAGRLARTAFTLRLAFLSYLLMKESRKGRATWDELSQDSNDPVPLCICNTFRASWVYDFNVARVGAFIDIGGLMIPDGGRQWHEDIADLEEFGVPLWFSYSYTPTRSREVSKITELEWKRHLPNRALAEMLQTITRKTYKADNKASLDAQRLIQREKLDDLPTTEYYGYAKLVNDPTLVPTTAEVRRRKGDTTLYQLRLVDKQLLHRILDDTGDTHADIYSMLLFFRYRQRPGETYHAFLERERTHIADLKLTETTEDKERRMARERLNADQPVPRSNGPAVFVWVSEYGIHYRVRSRTSGVRDLWERTTREQRVYNSLRNEYDVDDTAVDLADRTDNLSAPTDELNTSAGSDTIRTRSVSPTPRRSPNARVRSPNARGSAIDDSDNSIHLSGLANSLLSDANTELTVHEEQVEVIVRPISDILKYRYGYTAPKTRWTARESEAIKWRGSNWVKVYRVLGHWDRSDELRQDSITPTEVEAVADFLAAFIRHSTPPIELCDLHPQSNISYNDDVYKRLSTTVRTEKIESRSGEQQWRKWYTIEAIDGVPVVTSDTCKISTASATTIAHGLRIGFGKNGDEVLSWLLSIGTPVRVSRPIQEPLNRPSGKRWKILDGRSVGIGVKPHEVKLGKADYLVYMNMRDELLKGPAGDAALLEGGIMWRLAKNLRPDHIMRGPDTNDFSADSRIAERIYDGRRYAETVLTEQDMYVIVGVYRVLLKGKR